MVDQAPVTSNCHHEIVGRVVSRVCWHPPHLMTTNVHNNNNQRKQLNDDQRKLDMCFALILVLPSEIMLSKLVVVEFIQERSHYSIKNRKSK